MATNYTDLIPRGIVAEAITAAAEASVCFALGNVIRMSEGMDNIPMNASRRLRTGRFGARSATARCRLSGS
jgi:hypothetical protein